MRVPVRSMSRMADVHDGSDIPNRSVACSSLVNNAAQKSVSVSRL